MTSNQPHDPYRPVRRAGAAARASALVGAAGAFGVAWVAAQPEAFSGNNGAPFNLDAFALTLASASLVWVIVAALGLMATSIDAVTPRVRSALACFVVGLVGVVGSLGALISTMSASFSTGTVSPGPTVTLAAQLFLATWLTGASVGQMWQRGAPAPISPPIE